MTRGLRALLNREATDTEVADEVEDYLDRATAAHIARGLAARVDPMVTLGSE